MKPQHRFILPLLMVLLLICGACGAQVAENNISAATALPDGELMAVFFDVGQADSLLISVGGHHMLVDAGNTGQDELLRGYLASYGVNKLDYLVATHPHADHIGSMPAVVYAMETIETVLMPQAITTTAVFEELLDALEQRNIEITVPQVGDTFELGEALVEILAPVSNEYEDLNNYSLVLRVSFGQVNLLLTGDAEALSEAEQLASGRELRADVLKIGHHGSSSSSTEAYLAAVAPTYAVISCAKNNSYGHPHAEVLKRLAAQQTQGYRTDEYGTLELRTDGQKITVSSAGTLLTADEAVSLEKTKQAENDAISSTVTEDKAADNSTAPQEGYIGNRNSHIFHASDCGSLPAEHNRVYFGSREEALEQGYRACKVCKP